MENLGKKCTAYSLIKFRGIRELENELVLQNRSRGSVDPSFGRRCDEISRQIFGATRFETYWPLGEGPKLSPRQLENLSQEFCQQFEALNDEEDTSGEYQEAYEIELTPEEQRLENHRAKFKTPFNSEDETAKYLLTLGWDFYDDQGRWLYVTSFFCRQAEAVEKGIMGRAPEDAVASVDQFADRIEKEARQFLITKRRA